MHTPPDYRGQRERLVRKWMEKWQGGEAVLWSYTASHRMLVVRVQRAGQTGNLHIVCGDAERVSGPVKWPECRFELDFEDDPLAGPTYTVRDDGAGFSVRCGLVEVKENVKPVF